MAEVKFNKATGEAVMFDGSSWVPTKVATNKDTGESVAFDGTEWVSVGSQQPQQSGIASALRPAEFFARGFTENAANAAGAIPELVSAGIRKIGGGDYVPKEGYYPEAIKSGMRTVGETVSAPFNRALDFTDSAGNPTGQFGPSKPTGTLERGAMGAGRGVADVGAFMVPGLAATKWGTGLTQRVGQVMTSQPGVQAIAGSAGGATTELTDNPWLGLAAALGTGVGASVMLNKLAIHGATTNAERKILDLITKVGDGDTQAGFGIVKGKLASGGKDTAIVDTLGIGGEKLARASANVPGGQGPQMADDFVNARVGGRGGRLQTASDRLAKNEFYPGLDTLHKSKIASSKPLYDEAFAPVSDKAGKVYAQWDDRLQQFLDDPIVKKGMEKGIRIQQLEALADDVPFNFQEYAVKGFDDTGGLIIEGTPNLRAMDAAKRGMDETINDARDDFGNIKWTEYLRAVDKVRRSLVNKLDDITTDQSGRSAYKEARAAYAGPASIEDAAWMGRKFLRGDEELTAKAIAGMSEAEKEAFRLGARREISSLINKDTQAAVNKFAGKKTEFWNKIRSVFPDENSFNAFKGDIGAELEKSRVEKFVGPRTGSPTAGIQQDVAELGRQIPKSAVVGLETMGQLFSGHPIRALGTLGRPAFEYISRPSAKTAEGLAKVLLELDPKAQLTMLDALASASQANPKINMDMVTSLMGKSTAAQELGDINAQPPLQVTIRPSMQNALGAN
jgi:hypothetical protein